MSISFKEFSDILEKSVKSGAMKARSSTGGQKGGKDTSIGMKSTTAKAPGGGGKSKEGKLGGGIKFGGGKKPTKPKKDKEDKPTDKKDDKPEIGVDGKPIDTTRDDDGTKKGEFGGIPLTKRTDAEKDKKQREIQDKKRRAGLDKYHTQRKKDKEEKEKRIATKKQKQASNASDDNRTDQQRAQEREKDEKEIKREKDKEERLKKTKPKAEETMQTEASTKANKLHIMHSAKQIGKIKNDEEREREVSDLEQKAKKMGFRRDWIERTLEKQGAYGESYEILKQEAEKMHTYVNTLSLGRSVNLWAEAAKKDEDLDPVKGNKTLTKKSQEKITINPMEKQALRHG